MIIDTHSHIYQPDFADDIDQVVARARAAGVERILLPNIDAQSIDDVHRLADRFPNYCIPMMGLHPTSVDADWRQHLTTIKRCFALRPYIAVGEVGIDLYWDRTYEHEQRLAFEEQLRWSIEYDLPVVIHSRDANEACVQCIESVGAEHLRGVFHSFGGTVDEMKRILALNNFVLGVNGVITFRNSGLAGVLKETDLSHIVVETDSPYLSPVPHRGKRNESAYTALVVDKLAEVFGVSRTEVAEVTTGNAIRLFGLEI